MGETLVSYQSWKEEQLSRMSEREAKECLLSIAEAMALELHHKDRGPWPSITELQELKERMESWPSVGQALRACLARESKVDGVKGDQK